MPVYAIGDIHGQSAMLARAHDRIALDRARYAGPDDPVIHLGDLVDRGPDSRGVIDFLIAGRDAGHPWIALKGNHDRLFREFLRDRAYHDPRVRRELTWLDPRLGGAETLASYGVRKRCLQSQAAFYRDALEAVPAAHVAFLDDLPLFHREPGLLFVHAGIRPGVALEEQVEDDLVWIREPFLSDTTDHGVLVVHGHTALEAPEHMGNRVNLDSGAGYGRPLTAAVFEESRVWVLTETGRVPLTPPP